MATPGRDQKDDSSGYAAQLNLDQIVQQPTRFEQVAFNADLLDPISRQLYDTLPTRHMSQKRLLPALSEGGTQLNATVNGQFTSLKGCQSYSEFLNGLLHKGERIVQQNHFQCLQYSAVGLADECNVTTTQRPGGICLLTDKRLLLLSSQMNRSTSLNQYGDPKRLPGGYTIEESIGDTTYYLPIPLRFLRSVEMNGQSGVKGTVMINPTKPMCGGLCGLVGVFCGCDSLLKQWRAEAVTIVQQSHMVVTIGVLMPPWEKRMFLHIHANTFVPTPVVKDFVSVLQQYTPALN